MANVSYLRTPGGDSVRSSRGLGALSGGRRPRARWFVAGGLLAVVIALVAGAAIVSTSNPSLSADSLALARVGMPLGGGTVQSVTVVTGPHSRQVDSALRGTRIWPTGLVPAGEQLEIDLVVKRPGWISWLTGSTQTLHLTVTAPAASLVSHYVTLRNHQPVSLRFKSPVAVYSTGTPGHMRRHVLATPTNVITLPRPAIAGTAFVSAAPRTWESARTAAVSWFPAGGAATAVSNPTPGSTIKPSTPITLTLSQPIRKALGAHLPSAPAGATGSWHTINSHSLQFVPSGYGYGLGAHVQLALPTSVHLVGATQGATWTVPPGSMLRVQEILSLLHYLPLNFHYNGAGVGLTAADQLQAAVAPPAGKFSWRYGNTPSALKGFWSPGAYGTMTKGALMAFETAHGLAADGVAGPAVWKDLISDVLGGHTSSFGYTFVSVNESAQRLTLWHNGRTVIGSTPVNTGIASAPTATGTYTVYEHLTVTTMSGTNPDGSHYSDPGIPWVSYFNGGDALHGFLRAQYGSPQSLGCVEMPYSVAGQVWPYTPVGTLVHVE